VSEWALGLRFTVTIDGFGSLGNWSRCEGLTVEYEIHEYSEGGLNGYVHKIPGRAKYENIRLTRPIDAATLQVAAWLASIQAAVKRQTAQISVLDASGATVAFWNLMGVFPVRWTGPNLDVDGNDVATETLELVHNGFLGPR
jgi:phage tail-like protein